MQVQRSSPSMSMKVALNAYVSLTMVSGIAADELPLALARHATSKIASIDDLEAVATLGFRGEALASIASVSKLSVTSNALQRNLVRDRWRAAKDARCKSRYRPPHTPEGQPLEIRDLFYNTPARRKFLRTERTELGAR